MPSKQSAVFAVDIGGTKTAFGCFDLQGRELFYECIATRSEQGAEELAARVFEKVGRILTDYSVVRGVIAAPGPLCMERGELIDVVTMGWKHVPVTAIFERAFGFPFALLNDCDAGALGVWKFCGHENSASLAYMSISTGIGGGIVADGKLYTGGGNAANFGHIRVPSEKKLLCGCGGVNCLELFASGSGMEARYAEMTGERLCCAEIAERAREGEKDALSVFRTAAEKLVYALQAICAVLDPDTLVLGGSVCKSRDLFLLALRDALPERNLCLAPESGKQVLYGAVAYGLCTE